VRGIGHERKRREWTLTKYGSGESDDIAGEEPRVVRGGSWVNNRNLARAAYRLAYGPVNRNDGFGFRVVGVVPSS
jgi:formylglycine-generating enzyme required for sulfatase activity